MDLDDDELKATKYHNILLALEVLEHRKDYIVPNSDLDEAIGVVVDFVKEKIK